MTYWVYENIIHKKARIHKAECSFCGSGRGIHGGGKTLSGNWFGPFQTFDEASSIALKTDHSDIRACTVCIGNMDTTDRNIIEASNPPIEGRKLPPSDSEYELNCALSLRWHPLGRLSLDNANRVVFPNVESTAGLYKFSARYPDGRRGNYIGESENLKRRFGNYRNPGPTQQTSLRLNIWLRELLTDSGEVLITIAREATLDSVKVDLSRKAARRMFEQMAVVLESAEDIDSLNR